ncbi:hypothetical protein WJ0W_004069 [Paenibacillus melissococcoides]|uniref:Uncharacterized protein n=1 Tax=Paenibacillus melissococcoides TaxID=2912268 RepID=A0ABM9G4X9_9BACL|nr:MULTISPECIES: hypothetical protein [Paenibacillus]MEB9897337.1 hypothetical protein [Bacillus cereus]CAH8246837.1 hypothetical protein WJ0W_004069 [Paenibacillus melissococcoides]CAH8715905.1 hypothetical protein HTL2_004439 [Paenibacillus melissococcoides]CAH8716860.1 hypothetical protein WDD9_004706 [Paenibacillus melissococcoides]GIO81942.1 hypothetical protein J6TS7_55520 [Paenibacillus dendritiformis]
MKARKIFVAFLVTALMVVASPSVFAKTGFGDTYEEAVTLYRWGYSYEDQFTLPIDNIRDSDYYLIDYTNGDQDAMGFHISMKAEPGVIYDLQLIHTDQNGRILQVIDYNDDRIQKDIWYSISNGQKAYVRVSSHGYNDYGRNYTLKFKRIV